MSRLKRFRDEFQYQGSEYNRPILEAKPIAAIKPIFNPKESKNSPFETKSTRVPEYYNDNLGMTIEEEQNNRSNSYNDNQNKYNENGNKDLTNNADTGSDISNDSSFGSEGNVTDGLGGTEAGGEAAIEAATSTAVSSSATVVSTASLTGGVTIISACAVVAVTVGGNIMNTPPKFENLMYEPGTDYLIYEYDIDDFQEGQTYKLKVTYGNRVIFEKEIEEPGHHKELLTGLIPNRTYDFQILGTNGEFGDIEYYTFQCCTTKLDEPEAVFIFDSKIDYEEGIFDIVYDIYISDYFHTGSDTYLELYTGENLIRTEKVLDNEGFFRGALTNLPDGYEVGAIVYTTYYDKVIEIGRFGYVAKYPDDFNGNENKQIATFDFTEESFANTFNKETGMQELVISTNFDNTLDTRESYRIDLYDMEENLIDSKISSEKEVSFSVPAYYKKVKAVLTPIKEVGPKNTNVQSKQGITKEFEPIIIEYEFNPPLFSDEKIEFFNNGYNFSLFANSEILTDAILSVGFIQNNADGTKNEKYFELENAEFSQNVLTSIDGSILIKDVSSIDVEIYLGEYVIGKYTYTIPENAPTEELNNDFLSTYSLTNKSITQEYNNGNYELTIDTKFKQEVANESYKLEIYNNDELLDSIENTTDAVNTFTIPAYYKNIKVVLTPLKEMVTGTVEFDTTEVEYTFEPELIIDEKISYFNNGYIVSLKPNSLVFNEDDVFTLEITENYKDETIESRKLTSEFSGELNKDIITSTDSSILLSDIKDIDVVIKLGDVVIGKYNYDLSNVVTTENMPYLSTYTFNEDSISTVFDKETGINTIIVNTGFTQKSEYEKYRIDILVDDEIIESSDAITSSSIDIELEAYHNNITINFVRIKVNNELEAISLDYITEPALFSNGIEYYNNGYILDIAANEDVFEEADSLHVIVYQNNNDGSTTEFSYDFNLSLNEEILTSEDESILLKDVSSIEVIITSNDITYGRFVYEIPEDIPSAKLSDKFMSTYTFNEDSITAVFDKENLEYNVTVLTDFDNTDHENEKYKIEIIDNSGVLVDPIATITSTNASETLSIPSIYKDIKVRFVPLKDMADSTTIDFSAKEVESISTPALFNDLSDAISYYKDGYIFDLTANNTLFNNGDTFSVQIIETYSDDTTNETNTFEFSESITKEIMTSLDGSILLENIKSIQIIITLYDVVLESYTYDTTEVTTTENLSYKSTYTFNEDSISSAFDKETGINTITVNTGFDQANEYEKYRIDILYNDEIIKSSDVTTNSSVSLEIESYYDNIVIKFTEIKGENELDSTPVEYETPVLFTGKNIDYYNDGYEINITANKEYFTTDDSFTIKIKEIYKESDIAREPRELDKDFIYSLDKVVMTDGLLSELSILEITILYNEIEIYKTIEDLSKATPEKNMPFLSEYSFELTDISNEYDLENGKNTITINTGFVQKSDLESYKIVLYDGENIITEAEATTDSTVTLELYLYLKNFTVKLIRIKDDYEYDPIELEYESIPILFNTTVDWYTNGYVLNIIPNEEIFNEDSGLTLHIIEVYADQELDQGGEVVGEYHQQYMLTGDGSTPITDLVRLEVSINSADDVCLESYDFVYDGENNGDLPYKSTFTLSEDNITKTYNKADDTVTLTIDTGFVQKSDLDHFRIDILDGDDVIGTADNLVNNEISTSVSISIPASTKNVTIKLTPIKSLLEFTDLVETIEEYDASVTLFTNPEGVRYYESGFSFEIHADTKIFNPEEDALTATVTVRFNDESYRTIDDLSFEDLLLSTEIDISEYDKTISDLASFDIDISLNGSIIHTFYFTYESLPITIDQTSIAVDDDGNISFDYSVTLPDGATLNSISGMFIGANDQIELDALSGSITLTELTASTLTPSLYINYTTKDGETVEMPLSYVGELDLGLEITTSSYITYTNSELNVNIKFDVEKDGTLVNANLELQYKESGFVENPDTGESEESIDYRDPEVINTYEGKYFQFKPITEEGTNGKIYLTYKITSNGFDNEEKTINITKSIIQEYASSGTELFNYESSVQGYSDSKYINYIKTTNTDGTVNYYFDTGFSDNSSNHNERIMYTYTVDSKTVYKYTEFFTDSYFALENVEDLNYDFKLMIFYNYTDGLSYCSESAYGEALDSDNVIDISNSTISEDEIDLEPYTIVDFSLETTSVDLSEPISIAYKGNNYSISIPLNGDGNIDISDNGYSGTDNDLQYNVTLDGSTLTFNLRFKGSPTIPLNDNLPTVSFNYVPYIIAKIGQANIKNYESLSETVETEIAKYMATYNLDSFNIEDLEKYENSDGYNKVYFQIPEFDSSDKRDTYLILAYYNDEVIAESYYSYNYNMAEVNTPIVYDNVSYKVVFVKNIDDDYWNPKYQAYIDEIDLGTLTFTSVDALENVNVTLDGNSYSISANLVSGYTSNSDNTFVAKVIEYYDDGTNSEEITLDDGIGVDAPILLSNEANLKISSVKLSIYMSNSNDKLVYEKTFVNPDITLDDYTYNDGDDYISLPYSIDLPTGATITEGSIQYNGISTEIGEASGNYIISELQNSSIYLTFNIQYEVDGITYSVSKNIEKQLESVLDFDYEIKAYTGSDYYYSFERELADSNHPFYYDDKTNLVCYYDSAQDAYISNQTGEVTGYYFENNTFYDADGNELQGSWNTVYNTYLYVVEGSLYENIGCFKLLYTDSSCEINVTKAGGSIFNPSTGAESDTSSQGDPYSLNTYTISSPPQTLKLTMLHEEVGYYLDYPFIYSVNNCELEFEVTYNGETLITRTISYSEPLKKADINNFIDDSAFTTSDSNDSVTLNDDGTINLTINTGFDNTVDSNYVYKLILYEDTDFSHEYHSNEYDIVAYESDYLTESTVQVSNVTRTNLVAVVKLYYHDSSSGEYAECDITKELGFVNSPMYSDYDGYSSSDQKYYNKLYINTDFINPDYLDGTMDLQVTLHGTNYEIDLSNIEEQTLSSSTSAVVSTDVDGLITVTIKASSGSSYVRGSATISYGNSTIGYTDITYTI